MKKLLVCEDNDGAESGAHVPVASALQLHLQAATLVIGIPVAGRPIFSSF